MSIVTCASCDRKVDSDLDTECFASDGSGRVLCTPCRESPDMSFPPACESLDGDIDHDVCEHMVGFDEDCELCDEVQS